MVSKVCSFPSLRFPNLFSRNTHVRWCVQNARKERRRAAEKRRKCHMSLLCTSSVGTPSTPILLHPSPFSLPFSATWLFNTFVFAHSSGEYASAGDCHPVHEEYFRFHSETSPICAHFRATFEGKEGRREGVSQG